MKLFDEYPYLENDRIILRKMTPADAFALAVLTSIHMKASCWAYTCAELRNVW